MAAISKTYIYYPIFHVHILEIYVHIFARYEVSVINALTGQLYTDDTNDDNDNADANDDDADANDDDANQQWQWYMTDNHDCIGSLTCMPNEPKKDFLVLSSYYK